MNGVIIIDKPRGKTSHDMVSYIRHLYNTRKVGHTGTLDPEATGVLPICIGNATKACELLTNAKKEYTAQLVLGMTTDTLDAEGEVLTEQPVNVTEEQIKKVISEFIGEIYQIPPMYSAIKQNGKKLYELARQGISVEREKRKVTIFNIDILDIDTENETVTIHVVCSKGTYIRTLCEDIGIKLGCGAYMNTLRRTASGQFSIDDAYTIEQLESISDTETLEKILIPTDSLFFMYEKITVNERQKNFILNGVRVRYRGLCENRLYRVYDEQDNFLCISQCVEERLTIIKFFKS